uniref:Transmembrane protein n=1 Tax=Paramoeba aestuarina TaxID=180227 RepID=A0A7S4JGQ8_9EUKA|eukprot:CAMPEP_0201523264 /NCGR_PEP_ID=MMETSP0161_2-20130828/19195_1 /ASSEMBLY_ACC=CAM_ASM_000251 /TAXON_ID=180227 /ORGANISM="Neoparamoeba aestuarina, Strain SoJaBio B1-5/56/2" /LENGTH=120 /DNA_ID=CAMNT_0047922315 /DNA_START=34 /DNA_END=396 /DNA_ORIENTATION=+
MSAAANTAAFRTKGLRNIFISSFAAVPFVLYWTAIREDFISSRRAQRIAVEHQHDEVLDKWDIYEDALLDQIELTTKTPFATMTGEIDPINEEPEFNVDLEERFASRLPNGLEVDFEQED